MNCHNTRYGKTLYPCLVNHLVYQFQKGETKPNQNNTEQTNKQTKEKTEKSKYKSL